MSDIKAIILDFDGVIVESNDPKLQAFEDLFALYPAQADAMRDYHLKNYSCPRRMKFEHYVFKLLKQPDNVAGIETMAKQFSEFSVRRVVACQYVSGAREFLEKFSQRVPLYISSVTPEDELKQIIKFRRIDSFFQRIFGNPPWEKTDAIRTIVASEKLSSSEVLFIGDSVSDCQAALDAGVVFIGRDSGLDLSLGNLSIERYHDLNEIACVIKSRVKG